MNVKIYFSLLMEIVKMHKKLSESKFNAHKTWLKQKKSIFHKILKKKFLILSNLL